MSFSPTVHGITAPMVPYEIARLGALRSECERDHLFFTRYFFKHRQGTKFLVNWHHVLISDALEKVRSGEYENLVINVPPGSSKTEMAVINWIARCLAINNNCRFLHISSSEDLVLLNSQTARDIILSDEFQELWQMDIADDAKAKKRWNVMTKVISRHGVVKERKAGGVYAVSLGGQITGFRAGHMVPGFQGAILVDDPLKADDAYSPAAIKAANRQLLGTVKSRKANPKTPIVVIMQRLGEKDPTGFIKGGNLPGKWDYVNIPALITDEYADALPAHIREMVVREPRDEKGRFSYWPYKEPLDDMLALELGGGDDKDGNKISRYTFSSQYMQAPVALGGNILHGEWFPRAAVPPRILFRKIFADTAQKTAERNDFSVFQCWGMGEDGKIYLLDMIRGKWEAPELKRRAVEFWDKCKTVEGMGALREMKVEDKSSGTGLIQEIQRGNNIPVKAIERNRDKLTRVMDAAPHIEAGHVCLIEGMPFNSAFIEECEAFTDDDTHAFDDQIDPMCDAVADMVATKRKGFFS